MANKIELITLDNRILEIEPHEIEVMKEEFFVNTSIPYYIILLKAREDEDLDNRRIFKVRESESEINKRIQLYYQIVG